MKSAFTLCIDVGGSGLKASVLSPKGEMQGGKVRVDTPYPCTPAVLLPALKSLVKPLPKFSRVSVGFPGYIREGKVITAPHFGNDAWRHFPLADRLSALFGKPAHVLNDADMQGLAAIAGKGLELVVTLGTGVGTALFRDGILMPHIELAQHPLLHGKTYNEYLGDKARKKIGKAKWNRRLEKTLAILETLFQYESLFLGGGNSSRVTLKLKPNQRLISNDNGMIGGIYLW